MNRTESFFLGLALGIAGLFGAMHYSVVRAKDGFHVIQKISAKFEVPYVDIRTFKLEQWQRRQSLALSILKSKKGYLLEDHSLSAFKLSTQQMLEQFVVASKSKATRL